MHNEKIKESFEAQKHTKIALAVRLLFLTKERAIPLKLPIEEIRSIPQSPLPRGIDIMVIMNHNGRRIYLPFRVIDRRTDHDVTVPPRRWSRSWKKHKIYEFDLERYHDENQILQHIQARLHRAYGRVMHKLDKHRSRRAAFLQKLARRRELRQIRAEHNGRFYETFLPRFCTHIPQ